MRTKFHFPLANFLYAEYKEEIHCPYCGALVIAKLPTEPPNEENGSSLGVSNRDCSATKMELCRHLAYWSGDEWPSINEEWRDELFRIAQQLNCGAANLDDYSWQEALWRKLNHDDDHDIGWATVLALPDHQVVLCKQFSPMPCLNSERDSTFVALFIS